MNGNNSNLNKNKNLDYLDSGKTYELHLQDSSFLETDNSKENIDLLENEDIKKKINRNINNQKVNYMYHDFSNKNEDKEGINIHNIENEIKEMKEREEKEKEKLKHMKKIELDHNKIYDINEFNSNNDNKDNIIEGFKKKTKKNKPTKLSTAKNMGFIDLDEDNDISFTPTNTVMNRKLDENKGKESTKFSKEVIDNELEELLEIENTMSKNKQPQVKIKNCVENNNTLNLKEIEEEDLMNKETEETSNQNNLKKYNFLQNIPTNKDRQELMKNVNLNSNRNLFSNQGITSILSSVNFNNSNNNPNKYDSKLESFKNHSNNTKIDENITLLNHKRENETTTKTETEKSSKVEILEQNELSKSDTDNLKSSLLEEPLVGKGVYNALCILKQRGYLEENFYVGRFKDENPYKNYVNEDDKLNIEYRDNFGRLMTSKQANRYFSQIFQGRNKGQNNTEKELLRQQIEDNKRNKDVNNKSLMLTMLRKHQSKFKTPGMTLQSSKPTNNK